MFCIYLQNYEQKNQPFTEDCWLNHSTLWPNLTLTTIYVFWIFCCCINIELLYFSWYWKKCQFFWKHCVIQRIDDFTKISSAIVQQKSVTSIWNHFVFSLWPLVLIYIHVYDIIAGEWLKLWTGYVQPNEPAWVYTGDETSTEGVAQRSCTIHNRGKHAICKHT